MRQPTIGTIARATALAGTLDLFSAFAFAGLAGATPASVLRSVASGPFGQAVAGSGTAGALAGLAVHFAIMTVIATLFAAAAGRLNILAARPWLAGLAYGIAVYLVMYWIVLPARWPSLFPKTGAWDVGNALFSMIVCVGLPIALVTARSFRRL